MKLNLKVGIFISDNTDLWFTDASYSGFGTDLDVITGTFFTNLCCSENKTFPSEEYCGFKYATVWVTFVWNMHYFCELYTRQIIIYNLHKELNFNVHTVFTLSAKTWSMSLNEVCFLKYSEWCQRRWIGSVEHFYIISSFHYCLLDQGHILYNKKESYKIW